MTTSDPEAPLFAGKYRLRRPLGKGAMGEVWLADEEGPRGFRRRVAVKRLLGTNDLADFATESFVAEAQVIARLDHPNIVRLIEFGTEPDGGLFLVLDFVDGVSLEHILKSREPLAPATVAYIGREVARALHSVHSLCDDEGKSYGVVHRDVSPSNVLISRDGRVRLTDFGVARISGLGGQKTETGVFKGKLPYMPPEQARGEAFDGRADVFSLGVTLYELMLARRLRKAETHAQLLFKIATERAPRMHDLLPDANVHLAEAIDRATEFEGEQRFASAGEFADALSDVLRELGKGAEASAVDEIKRRAERHAGPPPPALSSPRSSEYVGPASRGGALSQSGSGAGRSVVTSKKPVAEDAEAAPETAPTAVVGSSRTDVAQVASMAAPPPPSRMPYLVAGVALLAGGVAGGLLLAGKGSAPQAPSAPAQVASTADAPRSSGAPAVTAAPSATPTAPPSVAASLAPSGSSTGKRPPPGPGPKATATADVGDPSQPGSLVVTVQPWGEVSVDGRGQGTTPLPPISLTPGPHSVTVKNPDLGAVRTYSVSIKPGQQARLGVDLRKTE